MIYFNFKLNNYLNGMFRPMRNSKLITGLLTKTNFANTLYGTINSLSTNVHIPWMRFQSRHHHIPALFHILVDQDL